jgi:RNA polymerase sigma-70 factor (ECF subfamily)
LLRATKTVATFIPSTAAASAPDRFCSAKSFVSANGSLEPAYNATAERIYEQRWALTLLDRVFARLRDESDLAGKQKEFNRLKVYLTGEAGPSYQEVAAELAMTEGAIKVAVHRLRRRYQDLVREEIAQTVAGPGDVDEELRHLFAALRSPGS